MLLLVLSLFSERGYALLVSTKADERPICSLNLLLPPYKNVPCTQTGFREVWQSEFFPWLIGKQNNELFLRKWVCLVHFKVLDIRATENCLPGFHNDIWKTHIRISSSYSFTQLPSALLPPLPLQYPWFPLNGPALYHTAYMSIKSRFLVKEKT